MIVIFNKLNNICKSIVYIYFYSTFLKNRGTPSVLKHEKRISRAENFRQKIVAMWNNIGKSILSAKWKWNGSGIFLAMWNEIRV